MVSPTLVVALAASALRSVPKVAFVLQDDDSLLHVPPALRAMAIDLPSRDL